MQKRQEKKILLFRCLLWCLIAGGFVLTRLFRLTLIPGHMNIDEAGSAYDALCLARYGVDRYGNSYPLYMQNFGTGQSCLYVYCCALIFRFFGYSKLGLRLPVVFFSLINLIFGMKTVKRFGGNKPLLPEYAGLLITFCPVFVFQARFGLDCQLMLGLSTLLLYLWLKALQEDSVWTYLACGVVGGLLLYSYILAYLVLPLFLVVLLIYTISSKQFRIKKWIVMAIPLGVLAAPLIIIQAINRFDLSEMYLGIFTLTKFYNGYRINELELPTWGSVWKALKVVFVGDDYDFSSVKEYWNLYQMTVPLFCIGLAGQIIRFFKNRGNSEYRTRKNYDALTLIWFTVMLIIGASNDSRIYRINAIYTAVVLIALNGFEVIYGIKEHRKAWKVGVSVVLLTCYGIFSFFFTIYYFKTYKVDHSYPHYFGAVITDAVEYVCDHPELQTKITFTSERGIFALPGSDLKPGEFDAPMDKSAPWRTIYFGSLPEVNPDYNYIISRGQYEQYCDEIMSAGFTRIQFSESDLYYME